MASVDVIIPAYNPGPYLAQALDSLLGQSFGDWRAFVVDDGSAADLSWVASLDSRIQLIGQANQGVSVARNAGIAQGDAPVIAFLDADDLWLPTKLERQLAAMTDDIVLASTAFEIIDANGARRGDGFEGFATSRQELLQGNGICTSTVMIRRSVLDRAGRFDPGLTHSEDWDLWIRIAALGRLVKLDETLTRYRVHDANVSADYLRFYRGSCAILGRYTSGLDGDHARRGQTRARELAGGQALDAFRSTRRLSHLGWALWLNPGHLAASVATKLRQGW